jgi:hypothetical protein
MYFRDGSLAGEWRPDDVRERERELGEALLG